MCLFLNSTRRWEALQASAQGAKARSGGVVEPDPLRVVLATDAVVGDGRAVFVPLPVDATRSEAPLQPDEQEACSTWPPAPRPWAKGKRNAKY